MKHKSRYIYKAAMVSIFIICAFLLYSCAPATDRDIPASAPPGPRQSVFPSHSDESAEPTPNPAEEQIEPVSSALPELIVYINDVETFATWLDSYIYESEGDILLFLGKDTHDYNKSWTYLETKELHLPEGLKHLPYLGIIGMHTTVFLPKSLQSIKEGALSYIEKVVVDKASKYFTSIDGILYDAALTRVFHCDRTAVSVTLLPSVRIIEESAFQYCEELEELILPEGLQAIRQHAFFGCSKLKSLQFPQSLLSIQQYALEHCNALTSLTLPPNLKMDVPADDSSLIFAMSLHTIIWEGSSPGIPASWFEPMDMPALTRLVFLSSPPRWFRAETDNFLGEYYPQLTGYYLTANREFWAPNGETTWHGMPMVAIDSLDDLPPLD